MKKLFSSILVLSLILSIFSALPANAESNENVAGSGVVGGEIVLGVSHSFDNGVLTFSGSGDMPSPDYFEEAEWAVYADETYKVVIENGITSIGTSAFEDFVILKEVEISETVTLIGVNAFAGCEALEEIFIPKSVNEFVMSPFVNCTNLKKIEVDPESPYFCSVDGVLFSKDKSVLWAYPIGNEQSTYIIPDEVETIEAYAFSQADKLTSVSFNNGLLSIGDECFYGSDNLNNVTLPEGLEFLGGGAFQDCVSLNFVSLPSTLQIIRPLAFYNTALYNNLNNWEKGLLYIGNYLITGEYNYTSEDWTVEEYEYVTGKINVKEGTLLIAGSAFSWFSYKPDIPEVILPESLKYINEYAFGWCEKIEGLDFKDNLLHIDDGAFYGCVGLTEISLPDSLTFIGDYAFTECSNLDYVNLGNGITYIGEKAFDETPYFSNTTNYTDGILYNSKYLLGSLKNTNNSTIDIKDGTELIANCALSGYGTWKTFTVKLPDSLLHIGKEAFLGTNVGKINIPKTVLNIGDYAIGFVSKTDDPIHLSYTYSRISDASIVGYSGSAAGDYAQKFGIEFTDLNENATYTEDDFIYRISKDNAYIVGFNKEYSGSVTIPDSLGGYSVLGIDSNAFEDCSSITTISIPNTITVFGNNIFAGCENITISCSCGSAAIKYASDNFHKIESSTCVWKAADCENPQKCEVCNVVNGSNLGHDMVLGTEYDYCQREGCNYIKENVDISPIQDNFKYSVTDGRACISKYIGTSENAVIPKKCGIYTATELGRRIFENTPFVKSVTIPDSITYIDSYAFSGSESLTDVYYTGSPDEWMNVYISTTGNDALFAANIHFLGCENHIFDNDCDSDCNNNCGFVREVVHDYKNKKYDNTHHWDACDCGAISNYEGHIYNILKKNDIEHWNECSCGKQEFSYRFGHGYSRMYDDHNHWLECYCGAVAEIESHSFDSYIQGETTHWKECFCGKSILKAEHNYKETVTKATLSNNGSIIKKCSDCEIFVGNTIIYSPKTFKLSATDYTYNGSAKKPTVTVTDVNGKKIAATNYTVTYKNNIKVGTATATVTFKGNYSGTKSLTYKINPVSASKTSAKLSATSYNYNGKVITPAVTIKDSNGKTLKKNTDYTVKYATGRKNVGKYKVTVTFKGNYSGTKNLYFTINPVKTTVKSLTAGKKSLKVAITKKASQVTGYQIQYATNKSFKSAKTKNVTSYKTTSVTLSKLSAKKTYYVRVRTYKTVNGVKYYSGWSTAKYKKTK